MNDRVISRRAFLRGSAAVGAAFLGFQRHASGGGLVRADRYGPLLPDPAKTLSLPKGFSYKVFSKTGEKMDDGLLVPGAHDGMAAFPGPGGKTLLVRNHELDPKHMKQGPFGAKNELFGGVERAKLYDPGQGKAPALGGTTTLVYDTKAQKLERHFLSLAGTTHNCAGGPTPWGSWITCEENTDRVKGSIEKDHGYNFEVPATADVKLVDPVPLKAMGRFRHEAIAVDPRTGMVYETEDKDDGIFYRFIPEKPGELARGGRLQALRIVDKPGVSTANHKEETVAVGPRLEVDWVDLDGVEAPKDDLRKRGRAMGAAVFSRGEGMWYGNDSVYFATTSGGRKKKGQIWRYFPPKAGTAGGGSLQLFVEPNDGTTLDMADNMTVASWGDLFVCENGPAVQFVVGITPEGGLYKLAENVLNKSEFAGATFSPDGSTLFVNIQTPGLTLAITGPWR